MAKIETNEYRNMKIGKVPVLQTNFYFKEFKKTGLIIKKKILPSYQHNKNPVNKLVAEYKRYGKLAANLQATSVHFGIQRFFPGITK
jgi:hypothetical protein